VQRARLLDWHARFTCFDERSELMRFNADPREVVPASADLRRFAAAVRWAHVLSGGLVDATLAGGVSGAGLPLELALRLAPPRRPAQARQLPRIRVDDATVRRPPGLQLDSGGLAKGLFADWCAAALAGHAAVAVDCAGDVRVTGMARDVTVADPCNGDPLHTFTLRDAAIATSGIARRAWLHDGRPAHHLLDPATGRPAYTGIVQASAIAPTALEAEVRAKAALLSGPDAAPGWLPHGGVLVLESAEVLTFPAVGGDGVDDGIAFHEVQRVEPLAQLAGLRVA
jgi:thiamine biosynthesis lipoprotein